jgi:hypothetical protein
MYFGEDNSSQFARSSWLTALTVDIDVPSEQARAEREAELHFLPQPRISSTDLKEV